MKVTFLYTEDLPYVIRCTNGEEHRLHKGDIIEQDINYAKDKHIYKHDVYSFAMTEKLKKCLSRVFETSELEYWKKLRHQAAVSVLSGIIAAIPKDVQGNYAESYADEAICIADSLVKKLIKMEEEE